MLFFHVYHMSTGLVSLPCGSNSARYPTLLTFCCGMWTDCPNYKFCCLFNTVQSTVS